MLKTLRVMLMLPDNYALGQFKDLCRPPQTREIVVDHYLGVNYKKLSKINKPVCETSSH